MKPKLRGWLHAAAALPALVAGIVLIVLSDGGTARWVAAIYTLTGLMLFATSAFYNIGHYRPSVERVLRRIDHSNIYLIIAGTYTPIAYYGLDGWRQHVMLLFVWSGAGLGVLFRVAWPDAPRALYTTLYVVLGWSLAPFLGNLISADPAAGILTVAGGVLYTLGAIAYATKWPDPRPSWFGFHEVFHAFTIAAWICQFIAISIFAEITW